MTLLHIEHPITDYQTWRDAFDRFADARASAGVTDARVAQPINDDQYIVVDLRFSSRANATSFLEFLERHVWSTSANSPGLAGQPRTMVLDIVE